MYIYKITNIINNKVYIGQTTQRMNERIRNYRSEINYMSEEKARPIIRAMQKYGFDNFIFEIIDETNDKEELDKLEQYYIKKFHSLCSENGYNIELGGNGNGKHSPETRRKISVAQIGEKNHMWGIKGKDNHTSKPVIDLMTGICYESATEAAQKLLNRDDPSLICRVCHGDRSSTHGHVFRYLDKNTHVILKPKKITYYNSDILEKVLPQYKDYI